MTTFAPPRHRGSSFLLRHRSGSISRVNSRSEPLKPTIFEGTDAVTQNRKVAVQRIVEVHEALDPGSTRQSTSSDPLKLDFELITLPNAEVRTFRHFLRMWDSTEAPDPEFDYTVLTCKNSESFETNAIKHFFKRIALWDESEEGLKQMAKRAKKEKKRMEKEEKKNKEKESDAGITWTKTRASQETLRDYYNPLTEVTTREGVAQLLWTLMHDRREPLAPELFKECTVAVKRKYGIES